MNLRRFTREDYPDAPEWVDDLFDALNGNFEQIKTELRSTTEELRVTCRTDEVQEITTKKVRFPAKVQAFPVAFFDIAYLEYEVLRPYTLRVRMTFGNADADEEREVILRVES